MKLGIIGKPQSGKTTVFNAASGHQEAVGDFSKTAHRAVIKVPDERVDGLAKLANPKKITYAEIEFLDAPGFSGKGKEAGSVEISPDLRLMEALMPVIDCFSSDANPKADIRDLLDEMILADQEGCTFETLWQDPGATDIWTLLEARYENFRSLGGCDVVLDPGKIASINFEVHDEVDRRVSGSYGWLAIDDLQGIHT